MFFPVLFIWSTLVFHATGQTEFSYKKFDGQFLDISAKGNQLWAVFCNNTLVRANWGVDASFQSWTAVSTSGIPPSQKLNGVGASPDGFAYALTNAYDTNNIYRYNPDTTTWAANNGICEQISSCDKVWFTCVNRLYDAYWATNWAIASMGYKAVWTAIGLDKMRWIVDVNGRVKRCDSSSCPSNLWEVMCPRGVETIDAHNKDRAVLTNSFGEIFAWDGKSWSQIPYPGKATRATITDSWVYWLNENGEAFYGRYQ